MKNRYIAPALAAALVLGGCSAESDNTPHSHEASTTASADPRIHTTVQVKNILGLPIWLSDNPHTWSQETNRGDFPAGALATAVCVNDVPAYPGSTTVYVYYGDGPDQRQGYASVDSGSSKEVEGRQQLDPGYAALVTALPPCAPGFKGEPIITLG